MLSEQEILLKVLRDASRNSFRHKSVYIAFRHRFFHDFLLLKKYELLPPGIYTVWRQKVQNKVSKIYFEASLNCINCIFLRNNILSIMLLSFRAKYGTISRFYITLFKEMISVSSVSIGNEIFGKLPSCAGRARITAYFLAVRPFVTLCTDAGPTLGKPSSPKSDVFY